MVRRDLLGVLVGVGLVSLALPSVAGAHERRQVGSYVMRVGWTIIPTRPGNYTFHFVGTFMGQRVDQSFTSSDKTFDPVQEATGIEFPAKDPSPGQLAERLDREATRIGSAQVAAQDAAAAARQARTLGAVGLVAGIVGVVAATMSRRRISAQ